MIDETFLTTDEVLEYLQVNLRTVYRLIKAGKISEADGMANANNAEALKMNLQGIFLDEGRRILS